MLAKHRIRHSEEDSIPPQAARYKDTRSREGYYLPGYPLVITHCAGGQHLGIESPDVRNVVIPQRGILMVVHVERKKKSVWNQRNFFLYHFSFHERVARCWKHAEDPFRRLIQVMLLISKITYGL